MTYRTRLGILVGAVVFFLILAPIVLLYTAGYRYNSKKQRIEKVGIIFVRSRPSGADIYLNGKLRTETTPARLRNLLPGNYTVGITKKNYTLWEKTLPVESERTTFAEGAAIFKNSEPEKIDAPAERVLSSSELKTIEREDQKNFFSNDETAKTDGFEVWVEGKDKHETITRLSGEIRSLVFYNNNGWIIYATDDTINAVERDGRDKRNNVVLASGLDDVSGLAVSSDESIIYFTTTKDGVTTLWKRQLR